MKWPYNVTWNEVEDWTIELAKQIGDYNPDFVIGISRGGWIPAVLLSRLKGGWSLIPIEVERIGGERRVKGLFSLDSSLLAGKSVLLVEDIIETGKTLKTAKKFLEQKGAKVRTVCFFTHDFSEFKPDYAIMRGINYQAVFPWERIKDKK